MKNQITQGEWEVDKYGHLSCDNQSILISGASIPMVVTEESKANAEAICKAVNNTYGKGIDPEKIGELIQSVEILLSDMSVLRQTGVGEDKVIECTSPHTRLVTDLIKALESIKLED